MMRAARTALLAPIIVAGGFLTLSLGSVNVFAASQGTTALTAVAATPQTSSKPHKHERVDCSPGHVAEDHGQCRVTFVDQHVKGGKDSAGQHVCFSVSPAKAGSVGTGANSCAVIGKNDKAFGTFQASGKYCGLATITATEKGEKASHHTVIHITCSKTATTTAALLSAGSPLPPTGGGWLIGAMGVGAALFTGYAMRTKRFDPGRLAANQSA